jgi:hypothetical protein
MIRFTILQIMDAVLTLAGLQFGAQEVGPLARLLMQVGSPLTALLLVKAAAFGLFLLGARLRPSVLPKFNLFFTGLVVWN